MKKLTVLFCLVLLVFPLLMTGCGGVAEADYEAVVAERDALQAENNALQADIDELDATQSDVAALVAELDKKLAAMFVISNYFSDAVKYIAGELDETDVDEAWATFMSDFGACMDEVGDDELSQLWDDAEAATGLGDVDQFLSDITDIVALLEDLIDDDMAAIEARVS
jgi:hypothetical protein